MVDEALQFENRFLLAYDKANESLAAISLSATNTFVILARMKEGLKEHPYVLLIGQKLQEVQEYVQPALENMEHAALRVREALD